MKKFIVLIAMMLITALSLTLFACEAEDNSCQHKIVEVPAVAAGCETEGHIAYERCSKCNAILVDGVEKERADVTISPIGHNPVATDYFDADHHYAKTVACDRDGCEYTDTYQTIHIATADDLMNLAADLTASKDLGCYNIEFVNDIDLTGKTWTPIDLSGTRNNYLYTKHPIVIDGGNHIILNLSTGTLSGGDAGFFGRMWEAIDVEIKNLTLKNANIYATAVSEPTQNAVGGFIGMIDSINSLKMTNCKLENSTVEGGNWAGGLYGYLAGYDNGVHHDLHKCVVEIDGCSVIGSTIKSKGSVGSAIGHAAGSEYNQIALKNSVFKNNTITCTSTSTNKAGKILGTNHEAKLTITNCTVENVTATSGSTVIDRIYGRLAGNGVLTVDGVVITES